jgi:hypothetical protein
MNDIAEAMGGEFDPSTVPDAQGVEPLPAGWYLVEIDDAEVKETHSRTGKYLKLRMTVISQEMNGRKLFDQINIVNANTKAQEIGLRILAQLGAACGMSRIKDSTEFIGKQVNVKVKIEKREGRDPENVATAYKPSGNEPTRAPAPAPAPATKAEPTPAPEAKKPQAKAPAAAPKSAAPTGKRPWER